MVHYILEKKRYVLIVKGNMDMRIKSGFIKSGKYTKGKGVAPINLVHDFVIIESFGNQLNN